MVARKNNSEEIRQRNKDAAQNAAFFWIQLANDRLSEINKQLLGIASILLPLTGSITLADIKLHQSEKNLLTISWVLLFISIAAGFWQIVVDAAYFRDLSKDNSTREVIWSDTKLPFTKMDKKIRKLGHVSSSSTHIPLIVQGITISTGLLLIMWVAYRLLFIK